MQTHTVDQFKALPLAKIGPALKAQAALIDDAEADLLAELQAKARAWKNLTPRQAETVASLYAKGCVEAYTQVGGNHGTDPASKPHHLVVVTTQGDLVLAAYTLFNL
jgi:hypothetical protein